MDNLSDQYRDQSAPVKHRCFISYKFEDEAAKKDLCDILDEFNLPYNVMEDPNEIESDDVDTVISAIREKYMSITTVTLFLIGAHSSEKEGYDKNGWKQEFIRREIVATLYDKDNDPRDGLLGIVLPEMENVVFRGQQFCQTCGGMHNVVNINDDTVIREFSENYYLAKKPHSACGTAYSEEDRFAVVVGYSDFIKNPINYIDQAYKKLGTPIAKEVHWRDIERLE